ncbi:MAG: hypothetical protein AAF298_04170 [Cyanobacteria bacterium P01_A01_bin.40]
MSTDRDHDNSQIGFSQDSISPGKYNESSDSYSGSQNDSWLGIEIFVKANHPKLLVGLEQLVHLNLISQRQVKKISRNHLSCTLPDPEVVKPVPIAKELITRPLNQDLVETNNHTHILFGIFQSFLDEISIRWLLFIGIVLVVISSGVLAASQWQKSPLFVQYLVLLIYTFGFWGIGFWTSKQDGLNLTSKTLTQIATLLIPINFWAINYLSLGKNAIEWLVIAFAILSLSASFFLSPQYPRKAIIGSIFLGLCYVHLFWQIPWVKLFLVYGGIIIITIVNSRFLRRSQKYPTFDFLLILITWSLLLSRILLTGINQLPYYCLAIALLAWQLIMIYLTPIKKHNLEANQQSLSENMHPFLSQIFYAVSITLLVIAWSISVVSAITQSSLFFGQTIGISVLIIHLFYQRLIHYWRKKDLTAIFLIGLQTLYLSKELIPESWRIQIWELSQTITKTNYFPESLLGIILFPYIILFIWVASWLYRRQQAQLAIYAEYLTLLLGIILTYLSITNPIWRSLNLILSTLTLARVAQIRHPTRISLVYLTHLLGLITLINGIKLTLSNLNQPWWGAILIGLVLLEWTFYLRRVKQKHQSSFAVYFQQSCWYFGLFLSAISYLCFLDYLTASSWAINSFRWSLIWLIVPGMLSLVAKLTQNLRQRRLATVLSCTALVGVQFLTLGRPETRLIALTVAIALMFVNAFNLRRTLVTITHLGFVLGFIVSLSLIFIDPNFISMGHWLLLGSVLILGLYRLRVYLLKISNTPKFDYISQRNAHGILGVGIETKNFKLINKYITALDYWAIALIALEIVFMTFIYCNFYFGDFVINYSYVVTACLVTGAIFWRYHQQPNNYVLHTLVWLGELLIVGLMMLFGANGSLFAIVNIILGLIMVGIVNWIHQTDSPWASLNLAYVPLIYACCGITWRLSYFSTYTGLLILGTAFILLNTQQQNYRLQTVINYAGVVSISLGIYELVGYQIFSATAINATDRLTIFAFVTAAIALSYRLGAYLIASTKDLPLKAGDIARGVRNEPQPTLFKLKIPTVIFIAHLHWALSCILKIIAAAIALENIAPRLTLLSIGTSFCLAAYAVIQGRENKTREHQDWWVYVGIVEMAATLVYSRLIISKLSLFDPWRVILTCAVALLIYQIPWQNLGWRATPWQRTALIIPTLMALVTAEDISSLSLVVTALFYLRLAYGQNQIRWSYISLGFINWLIVKLAWQYQLNFIWIAAAISCSILYVAQIDSYYQLRRQPRHYLRLVGSSILCIAALLYQPLILPGVISFSFIFIGLGLKIRAFLFAGTITLVLTTIHQLIILVLTYSFLKWVIGLLAGICSIAIAARFERQRDRALDQLHNYRSQLQNWH